jgi:pyruvate,water dikinase
MTEAPLVVPFGDPRCRDVPLSGGKGASLAVMTGEGLPVPAGFVVTSAAFEAAVDPDELRRRARDKDIDGARALVTAGRVPRDLVAAAFGSLAAPVAVRSSACAEDSDGASYAGQQETYLNVEDLDGVLTRIVDCWLSFFTDRAMFYREEKGSLDDVRMAVVVQEMVDSATSGVLFTADPVHGRRDRMVVEAARGLGEQVVSGEVTPDHYVLDRHGTVKRSRVVGDAPVLTESQCAELAGMGRHLADLHGGPQDIEWAYDDGGSLYLLQSRPITTL